MKRIEFIVNSSIDKDEFKKAVCFLSEDINELHFEENKLILTFKSEDIDSEKILCSLRGIEKRYVMPGNTKKEFIFKNDVPREYYDLADESLILKFDDGIISLQKEGIFLYEYFISEFKRIAHQVEKDCEEKLYPVLLPVQAYQKTGYIKRTPQYAMFCCSAYEDLSLLEQMNNKITNDDLKEVLAEPQYALSPSACFHTYLNYQNRILDKKKMVSFTQSVFRNEGRLNFKEFGRLRDYHVREVVMIGDMDYVEQMREAILRETIALVKKLNLNGDITCAYDPFILPKMQKYKRIQLNEKSKYELQLNYGEKKKISVASFNLHGTAFTTPFNIKIKNLDDCVTGCVGFGVERWVLAFLSQYGPDTRCWPPIVKEEYKLYED